MDEQSRERNWQEIERVAQAFLAAVRRRDCAGALTWAGRARDSQARLTELDDPAEWSLDEILAREG